MGLLLNKVWCCSEDVLKLLLGALVFLSTWYFRKWGRRAPAWAAGDCHGALLKWTLRVPGEITDSPVPKWHCMQKEGVEGRLRVTICQDFSMGSKGQEQEWYVFKIILASQKWGKCGWFCSSRFASQQRGWGYCNRSQPTTFWFLQQLSPS